MFVSTVVARFALLIALLVVPLSAGAALTLAKAEKLALLRSPWYQHHRTNVSATAERVTYEGRLPDPQFIVGVVNVPTDTYSTRPDDQSAYQVGLRQQFPAGDTLNLKSRRAQKELTRDEARLEVEKRNLLRQVRMTWFELYYVNRSLDVLEQNLALQRRLVSDAEGRYRAAASGQPDVLQARQALARLEDRVAMLRAQRARGQAQLARWIEEAAFSDFPADMPDNTTAPDSFDPTRHPEWLATHAGFEAARIDVDISRQEYKPGFMVDVAYGLRRSRPDGSERPDMFTALVTFDLPIFREKRQDRRLAEKQALETSARFEAEDKRRELESMYRAARAEHEALAQRVKIFAERILPAAEREANLTVAGFARDQSMRREARVKALDTTLELTRLRVDLAKSQAELLYLTGEEQP
ncbi:MAG TPA: TolC family protein [Burkholderiales bacterium]|nr:TolC family protein [Burkholderiales bacterium]